MITMSETLNIDTEDVYEAPMLVQAGDFTDLTQGDRTFIAEGPYSGLV
jgi:hypothetical protein